MEWFLFADQMSEGSDDAGVILHVTPQEVGEAQEALEILDLGGSWPF